MEIDVYVPAAADRSTIDPGSGIVGTPTDEGRLLVDYEGNRYGSVNLVTYADRVHHAAGRHEDRYPTVARAHLDPATLVRVGTFDTEAGEIDLVGAAEDPETAKRRIAAWCGLDPAEVDAQLRTAGSARHQMLREVRAARASGDPSRVFAADQMARRYQLDG